MRLVVLGFTFIAMTVAGLAGNHYRVAHARTTMAGSMMLLSTGDAHGSGVHIGHGLIVSAAHVLTIAPDKLVARDDQGRLHHVEVLWSNHAYDVGLARITDYSDVRVSRLSCRIPYVGEAIEAVGNPLDQEWVHTFGRVSSTSTERGLWKQVFIASMPLIPGMSGGPVLDRDKAVIGITVGLATMPLGLGAATTGLGFIVPAKTVCSLMGRE